MAKTSPTQRTNKWAKQRGCLVAIVERWNAFAKIRQDLFGFADVLIVGEDGITAVQVTSGDNVSKRIAKIEACENARAWLANGGRIEVHGWRKVGPRGKRKTWQLRRVFVLLCPLSGAMINQEASE